MDDTKYEQIVKKLMEFEKRIATLEDHLSSFNRSRSKSNDSSDQLLEKAIELLKQYDKVSASLLQRRLSIGYARAARLLDQLEEKGIIGPGEGATPRNVLKH